MKQITKWKKYSIQVSLYLIRRLKILHNLKIKRVKFSRMFYKDLHLE